MMRDSYANWLISPIEKYGSMEMLSIESFLDLKEADLNNWLNVMFMPHLPDTSFKQFESAHIRFMRISSRLIISHLLDENFKTATAHN
jgi:hypothetical protein